MGTTVLLSRLAAATELLVIDLIAQHDVEPDPKLAGRGDPRLAQSLLLQLAPVEALQLWILANGHQSLGSGSLEGLIPDSLVQLVYLFVQLAVQGLQLSPPICCIGRQRQRGNPGLAGLAPQGRALSQTVTERDGLQRVLHPGPHPHPLMTVLQQYAQIL